MVASCLIKRGVEFLETLLSGLQEWMEEKEYDSVEQLKGSVSQVTSGNPKAFERANYVKTLLSKY